MVQMALFPITGLGGFQSSRRNSRVFASHCYLVACEQVLLVCNVANDKLICKMSQTSSFSSALC